MKKSINTCYALYFTNTVFYLILLTMILLVVVFTKNSENAPLLATGMNLSMLSL